jgi:aspartate racemase
MTRSSTPSPISRSASPTSEMKTIGLIGGMSWESTAHYYRVINQETAARLGGLHSAPLIVHSVDFAPIAAMQSAGDWDGAGSELAAIAKGLEQAGAEVIGLATNTMHIVADQIIAATSVPFVHIADPTSQALLDDGFETVGLLGTRFTMEMSFYRDRLAERGLTALIPEVDRTNLNGIIYDELCQGHRARRTRAASTCHRHRPPGRSRGAEAVILGCTEITMLIDDSAPVPLPVYDTTDLHARALVTRCPGLRLRPPLRSVSVIAGAPDGDRSRPVWSSSLACASVCSIAALVSSTRDALCWVISSMVRTADIDLVDGVTPVRGLPAQSLSAHPYCLHAPSHCPIAVLLPRRPDPRAGLTSWTDSARPAP